MTKNKIVLAILTAILTVSALFAITHEKQRVNGGSRLYTTSTALGCRLANCWCCDGTCSNPCPQHTYYTQKTVGGRCKNICLGPKTTTN